MALPTEGSHSNDINALPDVLGVKRPIDSQREFAAGPKSCLAGQIEEAADAGHIDGSKKALVRHEEAQGGGYHASANKAKSLREVRNRTDGWCWAKEVRGSSELTDGDKVVAWELLDRLNWQTFRLDPAAETIARGSGRRARAVQRSIAALIAEGFLRKIEASGGRKTNSYGLTFPSNIGSTTTSHGTGLAADVHGPTTSRATGSEPDVHASTTSDKTRFDDLPALATMSHETVNHVPSDTQTLKNLDNPTPKSPSPSDGFETFWTIWGRHEDKGKARLQWDRAVRRLGVQPETVVEAARAYRLERAGKGRDAWETPALWLRREGYADDQPRKPAAAAVSRSQVFVAEGSAEWQAWAEHHRQTTGRRTGYPRTCHEGRDGWWFPTPLPPHLERKAA